MQGGVPRVAVLGSAGQRADGMGPENVHVPPIVLRPLPGIPIAQFSTDHALSATVQHLSNEVHLLQARLAALEQLLVQLIKSGVIPATATASLPPQIASVQLAGATGSSASPAAQSSGTPHRAPQEDPSRQWLPGQSHPHAHHHPHHEQPHDAAAAWPASFACFAAPPPHAPHPATSASAFTRMGAAFASAPPVYAPSIYAAAASAPPAGETSAEPAADALLGLRGGSDRRRPSVEHADDESRRKRRASAPQALPAHFGHDSQPSSPTLRPAGGSSASAATPPTLSRVRNAKFISYDPQAHRHGASPFAPATSAADAPAAVAPARTPSPMSAAFASANASPAGSRAPSPDSASASSASGTATADAKFQPKTLLPRDKHDLAVWARTLVCENPLISQAEVEERLRRFSNNWSAKQYPADVLMDYAWNTVIRREMASLRRYLQSFMTIQLLRSANIDGIAAASLTAAQKEALFDQFASRVMADKDRSLYNLEREHLREFFDETLFARLGGVPSD